MLHPVHRTRPRCVECHRRVRGTLLMLALMLDTPPVCRRHYRSVIGQIRRINDVHPDNRAQPEPFRA